MILVDTSVWIAAMRHSGTEAAELGLLLDHDEVLLAAPVRIEILCGASVKDRARLRRLLSALPLALPVEETWTRVDQWIAVASGRGERFGFADLLIGALAAERSASVWSLDEDFSRMARIGLVVLHRPAVRST